LDREGIGGEKEASLRGDPSEGIRKKEKKIGKRSGFFASL
jgi:hypothetical protein